MELYVSKSGKESGVIGYEIGEDYIDVMFPKFVKHRYSVSSNNEKIINTMKSLAIQGIGLSTYIAKNRNTLRFD